MLTPNYAVGTTALELAIRRGEEEIACFLLDHEGSVIKYYDENPNNLIILISNNSDLKIKSKDLVMKLIDKMSSESEKKKAKERAQSLGLIEAEGTNSKIQVSNQPEWIKIPVEPLNLNGFIFMPSDDLPKKFVQVWKCISPDCPVTIKVRLDQWFNRSYLSHEIEKHTHPPM